MMEGNGNDILLTDLIEGKDTGQWLQAKLIAVRYDVGEYHVTPEGFWLAD
jgi:hypothetical protein